LKKFKKAPMEYLGAWRTLIHEKNLKLKILCMYGKPAITCFEYQVFQYGLEAITYLIAILWVDTEPVV
jgi:hypothetical protein